MKKLVLLAFVLVLFSTVAVVDFIEPAKAGGTIYIRADGSIDPPTANITTVDNVTYTFTGNSRDEIVVERDNIVVDGAGYLLRGPGWYTGTGISLTGRSNVTIKNTRIGYGGKYSPGGFSIGIALINSSNNAISNNGICNWDGIALINSSNNAIYGNEILSNLESGIELYGSSNNNISRNNITENGYGISLYDSSNNNIIYYNNFIDNISVQAFITDSTANTWDDGYPSGGNYWSDYYYKYPDASVDLYGGPYQNETGSDGIWDNSRKLGENNIDHYPLVEPWFPPPRPPVTRLHFSPTTFFAGKKTTFNATNSYDYDRDITSYLWNFGDGNVSSTDEPIIVHTYEWPGWYDITLTILDSSGLNSSISQTKLVQMPMFISISTSSSSTLVGFTVKITGTLKDTYGNALESETVVLSYSSSGVTTWTPITSVSTDNLGNYQAVWFPPATGNFAIKAEWAGNSTYVRAYNVNNLNTFSYADKYIFSIESNSTVSAFAFNTTTRILSFTVTGPSGTKGYAKFTIAKTLVGNIADVKVYLDGNQLNYTVTSLDDSWLLHFTYLHSTHEVTISLGSISTPFIETPLGKVVIYVVPITAIATLIILYMLRKRKREKIKI